MRNKVDADAPWQTRRKASFRGLVARAAVGDTDPLRDYFLYGGPHQLSKDDCRVLATLIKIRIPRNGRRKGSFTLKNAALRAAVYLAQVGRRAWCKHNGYQRASKNAPNEPLIARAIELVEEAVPAMRGKLSVNEVRSYILGTHAPKRKFKPPLTRNQIEQYFDDDFVLASCWRMRAAAIER